MSNSKSYKTAGLIAGTVAVSYASVAASYSTLNVSGPSSSPKKVTNMQTVPIAKYVDVKIEALEARFETRVTKTDSKFEQILEKLSALDVLPAMQNDLIDLKIKANNEVPRLVTLGISILIGIIGLGLGAMTIFQGGMAMSKPATAPASIVSPATATAPTVSPAPVTVPPVEP